jgi:hypothetical protein
LEVDWFMTKSVLVEALVILVPVVVLALRFNVAHFLICFINLYLKFRKTKHLLPMLLQLLVDCFEVVDLLIELLVLWFWVDSLPLLVSYLPEKSFVPLVGVQGPEEGSGCYCLLRRHGVSCDREITGGGRQCWYLISFPLKVSKIKATQVRYKDLCSLI